MTSFRVDPTELTGHADAIEQDEPFSRLAEAGAHLSVPEESGATSAALVRLRLRLVESLLDLSDASNSLASATREAADHYQSLESSIMRHRRA